MNCCRPWRHSAKPIYSRLCETRGSRILYQRGRGAANTLLLQACTDPGHRLSILAQKHPATVSPTDCPGIGGERFPRPKRPNLNCWPITTPRPVSSSRPFPTGRRPAREPSSARPIWKQSATSPKGWSCSRPCRILPSAPSKNSRCNLPWAVPLMATKGYAAPEVGRAYARARELCQQVGETPQLFPVLLGLWLFYLTTRRVPDGAGDGGAALSLAQNVQDPTLLSMAHYALGHTLIYLGELPRLASTLSKALLSMTPSSTVASCLSLRADPGVDCLSFILALWFLAIQTRP